MLEGIRRKLRDIERQQDVRIIDAVESGSRAWGFASPDSGWDVRHIDVCRSEDYLRVDRIRDNIEGPLDDVLDFSGWDVKKALKLMRRTYPSLMAWSASPIVYWETPAWALVREVIPGCFSPRSEIYHYYSMATGNWRRSLADEQVRLKKYLYVLRPNLCARWMEERGTLPPVLFDELYAAVLPEAMRPTVDALLRRKKAADESGLTARIPALDDFLLREMARIRESIDPVERTELPGWEDINRLFRRVIDRAWED